MAVLIASAVVTRTRAVLSGLIGFRPISIPIPQGTLINFDKVWAHFKVPKFPVSTVGLFQPINSLDDFLRAIDSTYKQMLDNLVQASTLFHDLPRDWFGATTFAFTVGDVRDPRIRLKDPIGPTACTSKRSTVRAVP
jgi:hypothetical protein